MLSNQAGCVTADVAGAIRDISVSAPHRSEHTDDCKRIQTRRNGAALVENLRMKTAAGAAACELSVDCWHCERGVETIQYERIFELW